MKSPINYVYNFPTQAKNKAFIPGKVFATSSKNIDKTDAEIQAKGIHTNLRFGGSANQPRTGYTHKWFWDGLPIPTNQQLREYLPGMMQQYGLTEESVILDEFPENAQNVWPDAEGRMFEVYDAGFAKLKESDPSLQVGDTNMYGSYGIDQDIFNRYLLYMSESIVEQALTSHVHDTIEPSSGAWRNGLATYYRSGQETCRNANASFYMYNNIYMLPYELLFFWERFKYGIKTRGSIVGDRHFCSYSHQYVQSLVRDDNGTQSGPEEARNGDLTDFPGGVINAFTNPGMSGEFKTLGFWTGLVNGRMVMWGEDNKGRDTTKLNHHTNEVGVVYWTPNGGSQQVYQSGLNGAPQRDQTNGLASHIAKPIDSVYGGWEESLEYIGYSETLYYCSYTSSRKNFTAVPGSSGLHFNGHGPLNAGLRCMKHALDQKAGLLVIGKGPLGRSWHFYPGHIPPNDRYENVNFTFEGVNVNTGPVHGRQTKSGKF